MLLSSCGAEQKVCSWSGVTQKDIELSFGTVHRDFSAITQPSVYVRRPRKARARGRGLEFLPCNAVSVTSVTGM